jgi:hypothetical protein
MSSVFDAEEHEPPRKARGLGAWLGPPTAGRGPMDGRTRLAHAALGRRSRRDAVASTEVVYEFPQVKSVAS